MKKTTFSVLITSIFIASSGVLLIQDKAQAGRCAWYEIFCNEPIPGVQPAPSVNPLPEGNVLLKIPYVDPQRPDQQFNCGPNSAARLLRFYGHNVSYSELASRRNREYDPIFETTKLGTTPHVLRTIMETWEPGRVHVERNQGIRTVLNYLLQGRPIIALVRVGRASHTPIVVPALHYVVVNGFDSARRVIYYVDTDGVQYDVSYDNFTSGGIGSSAAPSWRWSIGSGVVSEALSQNGVVSGTLISISAPFSPPIDPNNEFIFR
ncbi:MAG: C39 family peptidase [Nostoc sp. SerVER01]|nr:C39 family peptidase [Nostoc sp. SerVER01]